MNKIINNFNRYKTNQYFNYYDKEEQFIKIWMMSTYSGFAFGGVYGTKLLLDYNSDNKEEYADIWTPFEMAAICGGFVFLSPIIVPIYSTGLLWHKLTIKKIK